MRDPAPRQQRFWFQVGLYPQVQPQVVGQGLCKSSGTGLTKPRRRVGKRMGSFRIYSRAFTMRVINQGRVLLRAPATRDRQ